MLFECVDGLSLWGLICGPSDGVTQWGSHAAYWIVGVSVEVGAIGKSGHCLLKRDA